MLAFRHDGIVRPAPENERPGLSFMEIWCGNLVSARSCYSLLILFPANFPASREFDLGMFRREIPCSAEGAIAGSPYDMMDNL
jgi:hypothetical protein